MTCTVWAKKWKDRGFTIERAIKDKFYSSDSWNHLVDNFPVIDVWNNGAKTAVSIKSIDLSLSSYKTASGIKSTINGYVNFPANFTGRQWSGISVSNVGTRIFEITIHDIQLTDIQIKAINDVIQSAASKPNPVSVVVTVIDH